MKQDAAYIASTFAAKQQELRQVKEGLEKQITSLQAQLALVGTESSALSLHQAALCRFTSTLDSSSSGLHMHSVDAGTRAGAIKKDIDAIHSFIAATSSALNMPKPSEDARNSASLPSNEAKQDVANRRNPAGIPSSAGTSVQPTQATAGKHSRQEDLAILRSKLVEMKKDQSNIALRLTDIARKRKTRSPGEDFSGSAGKRSKEAEGQPEKQALSTSYRMLVKAVDDKIRQPAEQAKAWSTPVLDTIDSSILKPLVIVDGIGFSDSMDVSRGISSLVSFYEKKLTKARNQTFKASSSGVRGMHAQSSYTPYDSPFGQSSAKPSAEAGV
ncbi:hypothetical protein GGI12_006176, partial [Dipsacomyces acuminosporus]